ncbi:MAG TPA: FIST N-terminal domain-containing protein, partial [Minicystis sp.]|nr:FIST N-terminal domain-containing protein [Minicystis sp.]
MHIATFGFDAGAGFSEALPVELDADDTVVFVFGAADAAVPGSPLGAALAHLRRSFPRARFAGCSTAGEIRGAAIGDGSLSVAVARFERTGVRLASAAVASSADSFAAAETVARALAADDLRAVVVFSDGLRVNGSELVRGLHAALDPEIVVTGGLAADGPRFKQTWVLDGGVPLEGRVTAVGLYGPHVRVGHGSRGGWDIFGPERRVTRAAGNVLYELDGKPALSLYKRYLGEQAAGLPSTALLFPLALR